MSKTSCCSLETEHGVAVVSFKEISVAVYCILVICKKKVSHASYDTLIYILNLKGMILPRPVLILVWAHFFRIRIHVYSEYQRNLFLHVTYRGKAAAPNVDAKGQHYRTDMST